MNANRRVNRRIILRKLDRTPAALNRCADGNDPSYVSSRGATEYIFQIICVIWKIEMCVSVDQHRSIVGSLRETPNSHAPASLLKILVQAASVRSLHNEENEKIRAKN